MYIHKNARLTPVLREELVRKVLYEAIALNSAAATFNVSSTTASKWVRRSRQDGCKGLLDRSSRPHHSPRRLSPERSDDDCKACWCRYSTDRRRNLE
jgi:transposase